MPVKRPRKAATIETDIHQRTPIAGRPLQRRRLLHLAAAGAGFALAGGTLLTACGGGSAAGREERAGVLAAGGTCGTTTWNLTMGQTTVVGTVTVSNDADNLHVTYAIDTVNFPDCTFGTLHAWAGNDLTTVPTNRQGIPVPGQFPHVFDATGLTSHTFTIALSSLAIADATQACALSLFVVAHAEVNRAQADGTAQHETAFGGATAGAGPRWWFYGSYVLCCEFGTPVVETCETAFAKGSHVFTTDTSSNPEQLPSLNLTRNRWGWAINLTAPGSSTYDLWAGAGLNDTSKGNKVGTLQIAWDGASAVVMYTMSGTCTIKEAHVYADDSTPTTIAPGQYGNLATFDPKVSTCTFTVPLADTDRAGGVWLIAHAVVCCQCCT